jgi:3-oxoacyl-[acyl-carrier-protein] synthase II
VNPAPSRKDLVSKHRVVITGMGIVTALGTSLPAVWRRLVAGDNGIGPISYFDASQYSCRVAAEVRNLPLSDSGLDSVPLDYCRRGARLFLHAAREAHADAGLGGAGLPAHRIGVAAGTSVNYVNIRLVRHHFQFRRAEPPHMDLARFAREGEQPRALFYRRQGEMPSVLAAKALGLAGPNVAVDTACAASAYAVGDAFRMLQRGQADAMIAGGACSIVSPVGILAFGVLGALSANPDPEQASRPFDRRRDGFVMGEGGGVVVLERLDHARARGARIYAEIAGYGTTMNAANLTDPSPDGSSEERAMQLALREAALAPEEIDYVAAHGTSTLKNDAVETAALKRMFGAHARRLMVSSNKGQIGHTISAAGVCNLIFAAKAIEEGWVPPTAHYRDADPQCDLDYVPNVGRRAAVGAALVNAFAFGGQNAVLAVKAA